MTPNPPIVVGIHDSPAAYTALHWAARDAALHKAPLHIVHALFSAIDYGPGISLETAVDLDEIEREAELLVQHAADVARSAEPELSVSTAVVKGPRTPTLVQASKDARLTVIGSRGLGPIRRVMVGSVGDALARHAHSPVAIIHHGRPETPAADRPIIVGVDGSSNSVPAIEFAFEEASHRGARLIAVHAWSDLPGTLDLPIDWAAFETREEAVLAEALAGYQERYPDVVLERRVVPNRAASFIDELSADAEMVVVGTHGRGGFAGMMLGSTSLSLLHNVGCPIVIVPSHR